MARASSVVPWITPLVAACVVLLAGAGCAGSTSAQSATSLVRARPTTPPATYALQMSGTVTALKDALDRLATLLASPRYLDGAWKSDAVNNATLVELGYRQLEGLTPPGENQEHHAAAVQAVQECQTLTAYIFEGINNLDKRPFDEVRQRVDFCRTRLDVATRAPGSAEAERLPVNLEAARQEVHARVKRDANLRGGPGTVYPRVATAAAGDTFTVTGRTAKGDWLQVTGAKAQDAWIAVFLVEVDGDLQALPLSPVAAQEAAAQ